MWEVQLLRRAPLRVEDPRAETSDFSGNTPDVISYNKGQCTKFWLKAVWARVIARRRLVREVGSGEERRRVACANSTRTSLEPVGGSSSAAAVIATTKLRFLRERRSTKAIKTI